MKPNLLFVLLMLCMLGMMSCGKEKDTVLDTCGEKPNIVVVDKSGQDVLIGIYEDSLQAKAGGDLWYDYYFDTNDSASLSRDLNSNQVYCDAKQLCVSIDDADISVPSHKRFTIITLKRGSTNYYQVDPDFTFREYQP